MFFFFFSSRRRHTMWNCDWSSDVCSSDLGDRHGLGGNADGRASLADGGHAGADRQLAGDEIGTARRAARLGIVIGKAHAFAGELVKVWRPAGHHALMIGPDVEPADVVTHD